MTKKEIKNKILTHRDILTKYKVKSIAIFGSFVQNKQNKNSDVDLLIELKEPTFRNYMGLLSDLKNLLHKKVDLVCKDALK